MQPEIGPSTKTRIKPVGAGLGDQAVGLGALHAQKLGHFALRLAAGEMQPRGAGRECGLLVHLRGWLVQRQRVSHSVVKIFS